PLLSIPRDATGRARGDDERPRYPADDRMIPSVRVLIADDDPLFMDALEAILGVESQIEIAGRAHDGEEARRLGGELSPDVVLMDLSMPVVDGFEASRRIRLES